MPQSINVAGTAYCASNYIDHCLNICASAAEDEAEYKEYKENKE